MISVGKLGEFCKVIAGQSPKGSSYNDKGQGTEFHQGKKAFGKDIIEPSGVWTTEITKVAEAGDILMSVRAPVGPTNYTNRKICIGRGLAAIRCTSKVLPSFIHYALKSIEDKITGKDGAVFDSINKNMIEDLPIPVLSLPEQQRIVDILDREFEKIDRVKSNAELNLQHAKDLFQAALAKELEPKEGWRWVRLNDLYNFIDYRGSTPTKLSEGIPLITAKNVKVGYLDYTIKDFIAEEEYHNRQSRGISHRGDILFTTEAPLGNVAIADKEVFSAGQRVITFQQYSSSEKTLNNKFYLYFFLSKRFQDELKEQATGLTAQGIKASRLKEILVPYLDIQAQQSIVSTLDELNAKCKVLQENYTKTIALCNDLKQALLRKAFNGEL